MCGSTEIHPHRVRRRTTGTTVLVDDIAAGRGLLCDPRRRQGYRRPCHKGLFPAAWGQSRYNHCYAVWFGGAVLQGNYHHAHV